MGKNKEATISLHWTQVFWSRFSPGRLQMKLSQGIVASVENDRKSDGMATVMFTV